MSLETDVEVSDEIVFCEGLGRAKYTCYGVVPRVLGSYLTGSISVEPGHRIFAEEPEGFMEYYTYMPEFSCCVHPVMSTYH